MILKKLLGEILIDMGFVTREQLEEALERQRGIYAERTLPEQGGRVRLVSQARLTGNADTALLLGHILVDMKFVKQEELEKALKAQEEMMGVYKSLDSVKLGLAVEIGSLLNSTLNLAEVLAHIMMHVNRVTNSTASTLMLLDGETGELVFSVPTGPKADELTDIRIPPGKGIAGWVAEHGQPALVPNVKEDPRFYSEIDKMCQFETKSILCIPLKAQTKLIGVLEAVNKVEGPSFTEQDALLLSIFAHQAAMGIENARLHGEVKDRFKKELELQAQLHQAERLEAIGTLAGGVAHDFNNLLMGIQGNASLMLLDIDSSNINYERLKNIEKSVRGGAKLTKQLLGFARGGRYEVEVSDLNDLVKKTSELFGRTKKEIAIHHKYQEGIWRVEVDQKQIEQVLMNLYINAWQAMPRGGELYLQTENVTLDENHAKTYRVSPGKYVKISVTDTGEGMDEKTQQMIFDPFFTTRQIGGGAGLGLASAYGIIRNHGGIINVYSKKGEGATFNIYLPPSEKEAVE